MVNNNINYNFILDTYISHTFKFYLGVINGYTMVSDFITLQHQSSYVLRDSNIERVKYCVRDCVEDLIIIVIDHNLRVDKQRA